VSRLIGGWSDDPLWGTFYDWMVSHPGPGRVLWRVGLGSDLDLLYAAAGELSGLPAGWPVVDVPCGGGVALRGVRPGQALDYVACDISALMLQRTRRFAEGRGVGDQVTYREGDVGALPFRDGEFDLVASFTGLHCFPDPHQAVRELVRVLKPGGVLTGSALLRRRGVRADLIRTAGTVGGVLGPMCTADDVRAWTAEAGLTGLDLRLSGGLGYFRATKPR
jgi:SAM-dependent methyltransferase